MDIQYKNLNYSMNKLEHNYGKNFHLLSEPSLLTLLAQFSHSDTEQPQITELIQKIYFNLFYTIANKELPLLASTQIPTRMQHIHPKEGYYRGPLFNKDTSTVVVSLARAGILPSHVFYNELNTLLNPKNVRQDHISISRVTDPSGKVTGSKILDNKCGGNISEATVFIPDPMGATGSTLIEIYNFYKKLGSIKKIISVHCIITPEFIRNIKKHCPDLIVYSIRLDRGLSSEKILSSPLGSFIEEEKGLNNQDYIVPGAGGIGEILNNSY